MDYFLLFRMRFPVVVVALLSCITVLQVYSRPLWPKLTSTSTPPTESSNKFPTISGGQAYSYRWNYRFTTSSPPRTPSEATTPRRITTETPSIEPFSLKEDEEIMTDMTYMVFSDGEYTFEADAYEVFDDEPTTFLELHPWSFGRQIKFYAIFYWENSIKGVHIVMDQVSSYDLDVDVELDAPMDEETWTTTAPRTRCHWMSATWRQDGLVGIDFKCSREKSGQIVVVVKLREGQTAFIYDILMYGSEKESYEWEEGSYSDRWDNDFFSKSHGSSPTWYNWGALTTTPQRPSDASTIWYIYWTTEEWGEDDLEATWIPELKKTVPYKEFVNQQENTIKKKEEAGTGPNLMGYLTENGYLDYALTENKIEEKEKKAEEKGQRTEEEKAAEKAAKKAEGDKEQKEKPKTTVNTDTIKESIHVFQKFNSFPETGTLSRDMLDYVKKPRCGNHDVEFSQEDVAKDNLLCYTAISNSKTDQVDTSCAGFPGVSANSKCTFLPSRDGENFSADRVPYSIEIDLQFKPEEGRVWDDLKNKFFIYFNYDTSLPMAEMDKINLFAVEDRFGFIHEKKKKEKALADFQMTKTQLARREFKVRIDIDKASQAYLLINGHDVGKIRYKRVLKPSVLLVWQDKVPSLITARICKKFLPEDSINKPKAAVQTFSDLINSRKKRSSAATTHIWGTNEITFSFQNYSTSLGEDDTRKGVIDALKVLSTSAKLDFQEVPAQHQAMITFMFIKGKHADGRAFYGAGTEKAHAYSPVHSEVHFNDHERFTLSNADSRDTSMFYVALHETGHALGLRHAIYKDAVMAAGYDSDKAFKTTLLHRIDQATLSTVYPGNPPESPSVKELSKDQRMPFPNYAPKFPIPRDCFDQIDAAFSFGSTLAVISNTFIWEYKTPEVTLMSGPNRVSSVLVGWNHVTRAAFTVSNKLYILSDTVIMKYQRFGTVWMYSDQGLINDMLNSKKTSVVYPRIRAAWTDMVNGKYMTTLVAGSKRYFQIKWASSNRISDVVEVNDSTGTKLLGKEYLDIDFTAAAPYERVLKTGETVKEVFKFDGKYVKVVKPYPAEGEKVRKKDPFQEIPTAFGINRWCAPKVG